jgi:beta-glucanase (GH16 family)
MTMPANSAGTVLMSTIYMWYGKVSATVKTSRDQGVVTAFM